MVYDMIDCFYPWRFHIGECMQNGIFPYWNPYQDLGYPIHADPSSGTWYPLVWLIGSSVGYTVYTIGFEYFIHVFGELFILLFFKFEGIVDRASDQVDHGRNPSRCFPS